VGMPFSPHYIPGIERHIDKYVSHSHKEVKETRQNDGQNQRAMQQPLPTHYYRTKAHSRGKNNKLLSTQAMKNKKQINNNFYATLLGLVAFLLLRFRVIQNRQPSTCFSLFGFF